MKKLLIILLLCAPLAAQTCTPSASQTCTPNVSLALPVRNSQNWDTALNSNFTLLDNLLSGNSTLPGLKSGSVNGVIAVDGVKYTTINSAVSAIPAGGTIVYVPAGAYTVSSTITIPSGTIIQCAGPSSTTITWTGSSSGVLFSIVNAGSVQIRDCGMTSNVGGTSIAIDIHNSHNVKLENNWAIGSFGGDVHITGDGVSTNSFEIVLLHNRFHSFLNYGIAADHVVELSMGHYNSVYGVPNNTTSQDLIVDTGVSGMNVSDFEGGYGGLHSLVIRNTNAGGAYPSFAGGNPVFLYFDQYVADTCTGGDCILFDSTLGTNIVEAHFVNSWAAGAGMDGSFSVITPTANGVHISGGRGIVWDAGFTRVNALNGFLIDNSNVQGVTISDSHIYANNVSANADGNGIYVTAATANNIGISGNFIQNSLGGESGTQKYGIKITSTTAAIQITGNNLLNNTVGALNSASYTPNTSANAPGTTNDTIADAGCLVYGHSGTTSLCPQSLAGTYTATLPAATGNVVIDSATQTLTNKSTSAGPLSGTVASGTAAMTTAAIGSGACGSTVTVAATGVATTDAIETSFNASVGANPGVLILQKWPTSGNVNFAYCNPTAGSVTPSAATINWRVGR